VGPPRARKKGVKKIVSLRRGSMPGFSWGSADGFLLRGTSILDDDGPLTAAANAASHHIALAAPLAGPHPLVELVADAVPPLGLAAGLQDAGALLVPPAACLLVVHADPPLAGGALSLALGPRTQLGGALAHAAGAGDVPAAGDAGLPDGLQPTVPAAAVLLPEAAGRQAGAQVARLVTDAHALPGGESGAAAETGASVVVRLGGGDRQDDEQEAQAELGHGFSGICWSLLLGTGTGGLILFGWPGRVYIAPGIEWGF